MRVLCVAGSREGVTLKTVSQIINEWVEEHGLPDKLIHGDCRGVDRHAALWARRAGVPTQAFPADWRKDGKGAGPRRNAVMAQEATHVLVIHTGSRGSRDMLRKAVAAKCHVMEYEVPSEYEWGEEGS